MPTRLFSWCPSCTIRFLLVKNLYLLRFLPKQSQMAQPLRPSDGWCLSRSPGPFIFERAYKDAFLISWSLTTISLDLTIKVWLKEDVHSEQFTRSSCLELDIIFTLSSFLNQLRCFHKWYKQTVYYHLIHKWPWYLANPIFWFRLIVLNSVDQLMKNR